MPVEQRELWQWHTRPGAFERLAPPWQNISILEPGSGVSEGSRVRLRLIKARLPLYWLAEHRDVDPPNGFTDVQTRGPFRLWEHRHRFLEAPEGSSVLEDEIHYSLPLGPLGRLLAGPATHRDIERTFGYRHQLTADDLRLHARYADRPRLRVAVSGASGLIGSALSALLTTGGHEVVRLVRRPSASPTSAHWNTESGVVDLEKLEAIDAIVHLAGESIAGGRWSATRMRRIRDSRIKGTTALFESLEKLDRPPATVICASAIGIYGDRGRATLDEASADGSGFLADVGRAWEAASLAGGFKARRVQTRFGVVLSPRGGALAKMLPPFRLGVGGRLGSGRQYMSWISLDDAVSALLVALVDQSLRGPINVTAPRPVTNAEFTRTLGTVLSRPAIAHVPPFAARLAFGRVADEALLASARVLPRRLQEAGFEFRHTRLEPALRQLLGRARDPR